ncbi:MAG: hypothetical protein A3E88_06520 [Legionellales bacterium RIFCSPHIGHO2_12_FULL_35_11]|nr:MAG: hypothetical protein A3E88_06520 [Legionellales bacterium RIFCSPHIGHO2_12_FULL_35_11]
MTINLISSRVNTKFSKTKLIILLAGIICLVCLIFLYLKTSLSLSEQAKVNQKLSDDLSLLKSEYHKKLTHEAVKITKKKKQHSNEIILRTNINRLFQVHYAKSMELAQIIRDTNNRFLSNTGLIVYDNRTNSLWVEDNRNAVEKIAKFLNKVDIPQQQILIEAKLVYISKNSAKDLGIKFGILEPDTNNDDSNKNIKNLLNIDLAALPLEASPATIGMALTTLSQSILLDMELSALESEGLAEIIANPKLLATDQVPAIIESGEDIPYQEFTVSGATSVSFKKAVLSLKVVPKVTYDGKLMMSLVINQDSDSGKRVQGVPIIMTKSIETDVIVKNGQTIVLGGVYKQDKNNSVIRVPFLGYLPIVGNLFRRTSSKLRNEELLIFITPKILH